jgi:predicted alpha/beta hydrolase
VNYAALCGKVLARAHARTGDARFIADYLGNSDSFDEALADFAQAYADQTEHDFDTFLDAIKSGQLLVLR